MLKLRKRYLALIALVFCFSSIGFVASSQTYEVIGSDGWISPANDFDDFKLIVSSIYGTRKEYNNNFAKNTTKYFSIEDGLNAWEKGSNVSASLQKPRLDYIVIKDDTSNSGGGNWVYRVNENTVEILQYPNGGNHEYTITVNNNVISITSAQKTKKIGHISFFFTETEEPTTDFTPYITDGEILKGITEFLDVETFITNIKLGRNEKVKVYDKDGLDMTVPDYNGASPYIGTGDIIKVYKNDVFLKKYTAFLRGDVLGDGSIDPNDLFLMKRYILGVNNIEGIYFKAANTFFDADNEIDPNDMYLIRRHILGIAQLDQIS